MKLIVPSIVWSSVCPEYGVYLNREILCPEYGKCIQKMGVYSNIYVAVLCGSLEYLYAQPGFLKCQLVAKL